MMRFLAMVVQLVDGGGSPPAALPDFHVVRPCPRDPAGDDVVVCGRVDQEGFRLRPPPQRYAPPREGLPAAEVPLAGGTLGLSAQGASIGGAPSSRVMLGWKLKF